MNEFNQRHRVQDLPGVFFHHPFLDSCTDYFKDKLNVSILKNPKHLSQVAPHFKSNGVEYLLILYVGAWDKNETYFSILDESIEAIKSSGVPVFVVIDMDTFERVQWFNGDWANITAFDNNFGYDDIVSLIIETVEYEEVGDK